MQPQQPSVPENKSVAPRGLWWVALIFAALWLATLGGRRLINPDEGRYAEIPREMIASGDWLTPRLNDLKYFEKPALQYWATAVAYQALGQTEFAARLWCGLMGLAGVGFVGWLGARLFTRDAGLIAATLLAGSLMYFAMGHLNTLDMGLALFLTVAIGAFLVAQQAPLSSKTERNFMLLAWASAALALLSKGVVALALPVLALLVYTAIEREFSVWRRLHIVLGMLLFLAISAPWLVAVSLVNPEFAKFFFVHEHFARFLTDVHRRVEPWYYFAPYLLAGALPWTSLASVALVKAWSHDQPTPPTFRSRRFLVIWIAVVFLFFSVSHSKLAPYILPVFPALALLTGDYVARTQALVTAKHWFALGIFWTLLLGYLAWVLILGPLPSSRSISPQIMADTASWLMASIAIAMLATVLAWALAGRGRQRAAIFSVCAGTFLALTILMKPLDRALAYRSTYDVAQLIKPHMTPNLPFYSVSTYDHALSFYLARTATVVQFQGELEFGQAQEPEKSLATRTQFAQAWQGDPAGSIAVMTKEAFHALTQEGVPMEVIGSNLRLTVVKKP